jgi:hypothetical protein
MKDRTRFAILSAALVAIYLLAALVEPCDGHSCPPGGDASMSALSAD